MSSSPVKAGAKRKPPKGDERLSLKQRGGRPKKAKLSEHEAAYKAALVDELRAGAKAIHKATTFDAVKAAKSEMDSALVRAAWIHGKADDAEKGPITVVAACGYIVFEEGNSTSSTECDGNDFFWECVNGEARTMVAGFAWWYDKDADEKSVEFVKTMAGGGIAVLSGQTLSDVKSELFDEAAEDVVQIKTLASVKRLRGRLRGDVDLKDGDDLRKLFSA
jgi:hypothetical protein